MAVVDVMCVQLLVPVSYHVLAVSMATSGARKAFPICPFSSVSLLCVLAKSHRRTEHFSQYQIMYNYSLRAEFTNLDSASVFLKGNSADGAGAFSQAASSS